ncbi:MAG: hypothetical protein IJ808_08140 [Muribaculaceae bacterium]|nr:hypothetical protein [Muribaculaceae bacterium]
MNKKLYILLLIAVAAALPLAAQDGQKELNKEITLEKDFVPVEKKATKKHALPSVKKVTPPTKTTLTYSSQVAPIEVPTSIPTMLPYGYRTAHNFSDKRGYLQVGGGTHANFTGSAGYRVIDTEENSLGVWVQHNSTWNSKNPTKLIGTDDLRLKQKVNDNVLGIDFRNNNSAGTLSLGARLHFDSFNYYGGLDRTWDNQNKQSFLEAGLTGAWDGKLIFEGNNVNYHVKMGFNHAAYDKTLYAGVDGSSENVFTATVGGEYVLSTAGTAGVELTGDYVNFKGHDDAWTLLSSSFEQRTTNKFWLTISPYYKWENTTLRARVGGDIILGKLNLSKPAGIDDFGFMIPSTRSDKSVHFAPRVQIDIDMVDGAALFVDVTGGKTLNTLSALAATNRYSDPMRYVYNSFTPFDGKAGFNIGPFSGFSARLYAGYGMTQSAPCAYVPDATYWTNGGAAATPLTLLNQRAVTHYANIKTKGLYLGAELNYKYRSLFELNAKILYAPADSEINYKKSYKGYSFGEYDPNEVVTVDLKAYPIKRLAVNVGVDWRGNRSILASIVAPDGSSEPTTGQGSAANRMTLLDLDDVFNLYAGANYRFSKTLSLWLRGDNLLGKHYDTFYGMGAQRFGVMAGASLTF